MTNKIKKQLMIWTTIKQLKEIPITLFLLLVFGALFQYSSIVEYFFGYLGGEGNLSETYSLHIPLASIIITKLVSFLFIYAWIRVFIFFGFRNIHKGIEEVFNGEFKELTTWQKVSISLFFLLGLLFAVILSPPTGF